MLELSACRAPGPPQPRARAPRQVGSGSRGAGAGHPQPCFPAQGDPARHRSPTLPLRLRCPPPSPSHGWARPENRPRGGRRPGTQPQELPASVSLSASSSCEEGGGESSRLPLQDDAVRRPLRSPNRTVGTTGPHLLSEPPAWPPWSARARRGSEEAAVELTGASVLPGGPRHRASTRRVHGCHYDSRSAVRARGWELAEMSAGRTRKLGQTQWP